jgi:hypothetical protein
LEGNRRATTSTENVLPVKPATIGFSTTPTLNKLRWKDPANQEYVRCGADLLLNGLIGDLEGEAQCPICGRRTQLVIANRKLDRLDPKGAIIHSVEMPTTSGRIWIECDATYIFDRKSCHEKWKKSYTGQSGIIASLQDYHNRLSSIRPGGQSLQQGKLD